MLNTLQIPDFEMRSMDQALNFKLLQNNLVKNDRMETDSRLGLMKYPIVEILDGVRLQNSRLRTRFRKLFSDPPKTDWIHPP